jgi:cellobiose-specific phosphotransferase system component IIA
MKVVIEDQIDAAITLLQRARRGVTQARDEGDFREVRHQLETAEHHLQDIHYNWTSLARASAPGVADGNRAA